MARIATPPLRLLDKHRISIDASPDEVWSALARALTRFTNPGLAALLGALPTRGAGDPMVVGSAIPGFSVTESNPPARLVLSGRHRFAAYTLTFTILDRGPGSGSRLIAATHAEFPGPVGRAYRAVAIDSGAHAVLMRRLLRGVRADVRRRAGVPV